MPAIFGAAVFVSRDQLPFKPRVRLEQNQGWLCARVDEHPKTWTVKSVRYAPSGAAKSPAIRRLARQTKEPAAAGDSYSATAGSPLLSRQLVRQTRGPGDPWHVARVRGWRSRNPGRKAQCPRDFVTRHLNG